MPGEKPSSEEELNAAQQFTAEGSDSETEADPESVHDTAIVSDAVKQINKAIESGDGNALADGIETLENAPTSTTTRQRDTETVAAVKEQVRTFLNELGEAMIGGPEGKKQLKEFGADLSNAIRIIWNKSDHSFAHDLGTVVGKFYHKHGIGALMDKMHGRIPREPREQE